MKHINFKNILVIVILFIGTITNTFAQEQSVGAMAASKVGVYVYPAKGQSAETLNKDESDCYQWAVQQSGTDPLNPPKVEAAQVEQGPDGSAVVGSAKGAAAGAAIGAIAGDAGKGAAIGAVSGALAGRRASKQGKAQQQNANNQAAIQTENNLMDNFKKAFSACLEGKGYTVN